MLIQSEANVLLVDDEPHVLDALRRLLRTEPYKLHTARNVAEAKQMVKRWPVSLVVTDEQMPGARGTELLAWLVRECPEVVRIVLTGNSDSQTVVRAVNQGEIFRYFTKPADPVRLALAIREGLERAGKLVASA